MVVDGIETDFLEINRGVPQGTVIGPFFFSLMVTDISLEDSERNLLTKFADDLTVSAPVKISEDSAIEVWASENRMTLNMSKTWEMVVRGRTNKLPPPQIDNIERKSWLNLLGISGSFRTILLIGTCKLTTFYRKLLVGCIFSECVDCMVIQRKI